MVKFKTGDKVRFRGEKRVRTIKNSLTTGRPQIYLFTKTKRFGTNKNLIKVKR